ncbi:hypothetical protein bwei_5863 [Bacillus mycoides]|nr:hypothetical protein bwei_5863 [Bacillus mycoides]
MPSMEKSVKISTCVFSKQILGPNASTNSSNSLVVRTSNEAHKFVCFSCMILNSLAATGLG